MEEDGELYLAMDNFRTPALNSRFNNRQYNENAHPGPPYPPVGHTFPSPTASYPVPSTQPFLDRHTQAPQHNQALSMMGRPPPAPQPQRTNYSQVNLPSRSQNKSLSKNTEVLSARSQYRPVYEDDSLPQHPTLRTPSNESVPPTRPPKPPFLGEIQTLKPLTDERRLLVNKSFGDYNQPPPIEPRRGADGEDVYLQIDAVNEAHKDGGMFQPQFRPINDLHDPTQLHSPHFQPYLTSAGRRASYTPNDYQEEKVYEPTPHSDSWSRNSSASSSTVPGFQHPKNRTSLPSPRRRSANSFPTPCRNGSNKSQGSSSSGEHTDVEATRPQRDSQPQRPYQPIKNSFDSKFDRPQPPTVSSSMVMPPVTFPQTAPQNFHAGMSSMPPMMPADVPQTTAVDSGISDTGPSNEPPNKSKNVVEQSWYRNMDRKRAEAAIREQLKDGCFIVRPGKGLDTPYSLTVCNDSQISNLQIRRREDGNFAFGKEKEYERSFPDVVDLITYHMESALVLADKKGSVILTGPP